MVFQRVEFPPDFCRPRRFAASSEHRLLQRKVAAIIRGETSRGLYKRQNSTGNSPTRCHCPRGKGNQHLNANKAPFKHISGAHPATLCLDNLISAFKLPPDSGIRSGDR